MINHTAVQEGGQVGGYCPPVVCGGLLGLAPPLTEVVGWEHRVVDAALLFPPGRLAHPLSQVRALGCESFCFSPAGFLSLNDFWGSELVPAVCGPMGS